jgi:hypothetical protein
MFAQKTAMVVERTENSVTVECDGVRLTWPSSTLPATKVGDTVHLVALTHDSLKGEQNAVAISLLHELLNPSASRNSGTQTH